MSGSTWTLKQLCNEINARHCQLVMIVVLGCHRARTVAEYTFPANITFDVREASALNIAVVCMDWADDIDACHHLNTMSKQWWPRESWATVRQGMLAAQFQQLNDILVGACNVFRPGAVRDGVNPAVVIMCEDGFSSSGMLPLQTQFIALLPVLPSSCRHVNVFALVRLPRGAFVQFRLQQPLPRTVDTGLRKLSLKQSRTAGLWHRYHFVPRTTFGV